MTREQYIASLRKLHLNLYRFGEKVENVVDDPIVCPSLNSFAAPHMPFEDCALDMTMPKAAARRVLGAKAYEKPGSIEPGFGLVR